MSNYNQLRQRAIAYEEAWEAHSLADDKEMDEVDFDEVNRLDLLREQAENKYHSAAMPTTILGLLDELETAESQGYKRGLEAAMAACEQAENEQEAHFKEWGEHSAVDGTGGCIACQVKLEALLALCSESEPMEAAAWPTSRIATQTLKSMTS